MGEIKSVKVDNWGVFFLQKLQNFFNKTDYCDLTLQFRDNSQLKVHRLVLSACTDFFNVLEQTCELMDDALVMPMELQADVVVPIVNFMYTGTLEFELKMYSKLLKTAKEMNMTVLLKLLEAHKRTMESSKPSTQRANSPKNRGRRPANSPGLTKFISTPSTISATQQAQRRMITTTNTTAPMRRIITGKPMHGSTVFRQIGSSIIKPAAKMQRGPTRYESVESNLHGDAFESSFDNISYESKPLKEEPDDFEEMHGSPSKSRSSPFEQLRKGYNNNKRPAVSTFTSPPAKKPNIEDVKEFSEQQRMRKQIAAEYGDDAEYDGILDDEFHNDDDDDEPAAGGPSSSAVVRQQQQQNQGQASIIIKQSNNDKPTIVVKDTSNSKMDHAKIISEVLRQYPNLVKGNKNIKLKIMPNISGQTQKVVVKKEPFDEDGAEAEHEPSQAVGSTQHTRQQLMQISQNKQTLLKQTVTKPVASTTARVQVQTTQAPAGGTAAASGTQQKRRIDSKTMHTLIALGAENTTGPWLCLRCGINGRPISIPSYRGFRRHLIHTHKETIDPALCEHCGWRSSNERTLYYHMLTEHNLSSPLYVFPKCNYCANYCFDENELSTHIRQKHPDKQQCIYCNKTFPKEIQLYNHMKAFHKTLAREDGVVDFSDDEMADFEEEIRRTEIVPEKKIKILSDISLPTTILKLDEVPAIDEEYVTDNGPKFVNAEGNEMVLTAEQREEIMSQLEQDHGGVVMVLNETAFAPGDGELDAEAEAEAEEDTVGEVVKEEESIEQYDDHQIYNEFSSEEKAAFDRNEEVARLNAANSGSEKEEKTHEEQEHDEQMEEDHMVWAENVISTHDPDEEAEEYHADEEQADETAKKASPIADSPKEDDEKVSSSKSPLDSAKEEKDESKKEDEISLKLKMLTGDWTDDEIEEEEDAAMEQSEKDKSTEDEPSTSVKHDDLDEPSAANADKKQKRPSKDEPQPEQEVKGKSDADTATVTANADDEVSQSDENIEKSKKELLDDKLNQAATEDDPNKSEESISETLSAIEAEIQGKSPTPEPECEKKSTSRRSSAKESVVEAEKAPSKSDEDDFSNDNVTSSKKSEDDVHIVPDDDVEHNEGKTADNKSISDVDKEEAVTSTKPSDEDNLKSLDKVKSLISEWVDDDEDL